MNREQLQTIALKIAAKIIKILYKDLVLPYRKKKNPKTQFTEGAALNEKS